MYINLNKIMFLKICKLFNFWLFVHIPVKRFAKKVNYAFNHVHLFLTLTMFAFKASFIHESSIAFYALDFLLMNSYKCISKMEKFQYNIHHIFAIFFLSYDYPLMRHIYFITELSNIPLAVHHYVNEYFPYQTLKIHYMSGKILWYFYFRCIYPIHLIPQGISTLPTYIMVVYFGFYMIGPYHSYTMIKDMINI